MELNNVQARGQSLEAANANFMASVYKWMALGLGISGLTAYFVADSDLIYFAYNWMTFLMIFQVGLVLGLSFFIEKMSSTMASLCFLIYSLATGVVFSTIFMVYTRESIDAAFFTTAIAFSGLSFFGYVTKKDLGPVGSFCYMGLFGLVGFSIINLIFPSTFTHFSSKLTGLVGIVVFSGLTAYDTQKIKALNGGAIYDSEVRNKMVIRGALCLYLDFINLFLYILRIFGNRKN